MEKLYSILQEIRAINDAYGISNDKIDKLEEEMGRAKVCVPVIGKFSSGKSALINAVLGYNRKILQENITPETAVPAEILYVDDEDRVIITNNDESEQKLTVDEYRHFEADATTVKSARLNLINDFLQNIPDVMIVDMPGFESGCEIHNKAIDDYLPQSMAYIIAVPADDMIIRSSVGNILKELCLHDMPICVAITKCDKCAEDEFEVKFENMKNSLKRYIGDREIRYCKTSSSEGEIAEIKEFLEGIQDKSEELLYKKFSQRVLLEMNSAENYLTQQKNASALSESELDEEEERIKQKMSDFRKNVLEGKDDFKTELEECKVAIKDDVGMALECVEYSLTTMVLNGGDIDDALNNTVRSAVTESTKKRLIPVVEKYVKKVSKSMSEMDIGDINVAFSFDADEIKTKFSSSIVAAIAVSMIATPVIGILVGLGSAIINRFQGDKKREEARAKIGDKLRNEVFPKVLRQVEEGVDQVIKEQMLEIGDTVENEIDRQQDILEKAMADVRSRKEDEQIKKENYEIDLNNDLARLGEIKDEL